MHMNKAGREEGLDASVADKCGETLGCRCGYLTLNWLPLEDNHSLSPFASVSSTSQSVERDPGRGFHQRLARAKRTHSVEEKKRVYTCLVHGQSDFTVV